MPLCDRCASVSRLRSREDLEDAAGDIVADGSGGQPARPLRPFPSILGCCNSDGDLGFCGDLTNVEALPAEGRLDSRPATETMKVVVQQSALAPPPFDITRGPASSQRQEQPGADARRSVTLDLAKPPSLPLDQASGKAAADSKGWKFVARMDEEEMLSHSYWCVYCCCFGVGCSHALHQLGLAWNCCTIAQTCYTSPRSATDGCCSMLVSSLCFTCLGMLPPRPGHPRCIICNHDQCGIVGGWQAAFKSKGSALDTYDRSVFEQFVPFYCGLCGFALSPTVLALIETSCRCSCCFCRTYCDMPSMEAGCCACLLNAWCIHAQCKFPPTCHHSPIVAIAGSSLRERIYQSAPHQKVMR